MALDFYQIDDLRLETKLFEIDQGAFEYIDDVLGKTTQMTGIRIDPYGKTVIHDNHVQFLIKNIEDLLNSMGYNEKPKKKNDAILTNLAFILIQLEKVKSGTIIIGD